ncbi:MAG: M81 family metallopeptidase [Rhodobacteraceae bacterium]|nr:M81 family metallopeptidase [Paracoccaceae bacterium]MCY4328143.1 M81 family metallopeptidase [Paracoccaceae bacterium]
MTRVAVAGFQHETNTFAPIPTTLADFERGGAWPKLSRKEELCDYLRGLNLPLAGFLEHCRVETVPILWTAAEPGGIVCDDAFDRISREIVDGIVESGCDAAYLDLHGAMVTRRHDDAEAELLSRIRQRMGHQFPIAVSLDLHGNLSRRFFDHATVVTVYRTYPHVDIAATGARAAELLERALATPLAKSFQQLDVLIPITAQSTFHSPGRDIYSSLESQRIVSADICLGFPPADIPFCGPSVFTYDDSQIAADRAAAEIAQSIRDAESQFDSRLVSAATAVQMALDGDPEATTVIADPQDNPGAGATSDTTGLLQELLHARVPDAILGMLYDPQVANAAHQAGIGATIHLEIGGKFSQFSKTVKAEVTVVALSDGQFQFSGPMYGGARANLGPMAQLRLTGTGIRLVVGSVRAQNADQEIFRAVGIEPKQHRIICVKSAVHFLADYHRIADRIVFAESPGANPCQLAKIDFKRLRPGMRFIL